MAKRRYTPTPNGRKPLPREQLPKSYAAAIARLFGPSAQPKTVLRSTR
jgi:hypothetical protein